MIKMLRGQVKKLQIMPKKKNGMPFEAHPSPMKTENGENLLYVKPKSGLKMSLEDVETWSLGRNAIRKGDMGRVFDAFMDGAAYWMSRGFRIETPIGIFSPKISLKRQETDPDNIHHDDVELQGIDYQSAKPFEKELKIKIGTDGFRYVRIPVSSRIMNNQEHLEKALQESIKANNGYTTVRSFSFYSGLTEHSARKQLARWCHGNNPKLQMSRIAHAHIYTEI